VPVLPALPPGRVGPALELAVPLEGLGTVLVGGCVTGVWELDWASAGPARSAPISTVQIIAWRMLAFLVGGGDVPPLPD
jgi:hypothetical protein